MVWKMMKSSLHNYHIVNKLQIGNDSLKEALIIFFEKFVAEKGAEIAINGNESKF